MPVTFMPRWKEELVCRMDGHGFIIEMTMGIAHVYLPDEEKWESSAPDWAKGQWARVLADLERWCAGQSLPLTVDGNMWVHFDPKE